MTNVRKSLKKLRVELDLNQKQFAELIQMPISTYRRKECEETPLTLNEAFKISSAVNKSLDEIFS